MKKRRYRPRPVITDPLTLLRPASKDRAGKVMLTFLTALDCIERGQHPGEEEWRSLSDAVNTLETMCVIGMLDSAEVMPIVSAAVVAMALAAKRFHAGHGMRFDGPGIRALRDVIDVYRQCLEGYTEREMARAQQATRDRMRRLLMAKNPGAELIAV